MDWIKLHRQLLQWEWFDNSAMVHVFVYCLLRANYSDNEWHNITINRGQFVTSLNSINSATGLSFRKIRTCLNKLEKSGEIIIKTTNKYTIITICNYDIYQDTKNENDKQTTNKRQTNDKQTTTNKNKEEGEEGKDISLIEANWRDDFDIYLKECKQAFRQLTDDEEFIRQQSKYNPNIDVKMTIEKAFANYWGTEAGWKNKKSKSTKKIDWRRTIINALNSPLNKFYKT